MDDHAHKTLRYFSQTKEYNDIDQFLLGHEMEGEKNELKNSNFQLKYLIHDLKDFISKLPTC